MITREIQSHYVNLQTIKFRLKIICAPGLLIAYNSQKCECPAHIESFDFSTGLCTHNFSSKGNGALQTFTVHNLKKSPCTPIPNSASIKTHTQLACVIDWLTLEALNGW